MSFHLHIDPFSGIAGDMFLGALIDLGVDREQLIRAFQGLTVFSRFTITTEKVQRNAITATNLQVPIKPKHKENNPHDSDSNHHHHHTGYRQIMDMVNQLDTTERGKRRAERIVNLLAEAEAAVHGKTVDEIHFHEVGAIDSIVDMLGAAVGLELAEVSSVSCGPLPLSYGFVECDHGRMPLPAPATAHLCQDLPVFGVPREGELVTPTGAAIVKAVTDHFGPPPPMTIRKVGYGAGDHQYDDKTPNVLRLILGEMTSTNQVHQP